MEYAEYKTMSKNQLRRAIVETASTINLDKNRVLPRDFYIQIKSYSKKQLIKALMILKVQKRGTILNRIFIRIFMAIIKPFGWMRRIFS